MSTHLKQGQGSRVKLAIDRVQDDHNACTSGFLHTILSWVISEGAGQESEAGKQGKKKLFVQMPVAVQRRTLP